MSEPFDSWDAVLPDPELWDAPDHLGREDLRGLAVWPPTRERRHGEEEMFE